MMPVLFMCPLTQQHARTGFAADDATAARPWLRCCSRPRQGPTLRGVPLALQLLQHAAHLLRLLLQVCMQMRVWVAGRPGQKVIRRLHHAR